MSSCLFKEKSGNYEVGVKLTGITWGLLTIIPIIAIPVTVLLHRGIFNIRWSKSDHFLGGDGDKPVWEKKGMRTV